MRTIKFSIGLLAILFIFSGCEKDSEVLEPEVEQETNASARLTAKNLYNTHYEDSASVETDPQWAGDETTCDPGNVSQAVLDKIFTRLLYFRRAVGLNNGMTESKLKSEKAQRAALMMQANNTLDHFPSDSWKCYSPEGKEGAGNSLLTTVVNAEAIDSYMRDAGSANGGVGHRRWLLWPNLQEIGVGNTDHANAIWVLGNAGTPPEDAPEFISWPPKGYVPERLVYPRWSFSLKDADFTQAQVAMEDSAGNNISLTIEELDNQFGDRTIVWVPEGITTNVSQDTTYSVSITGVNIKGNAKDFSYSVIVFDPNE